MGLFERSRVIAKPGWSRWLVPPAALAIHLSIGQAYAWSVFKTPLGSSSLHLSGVQTALPFQVAIAMLGLSAAFGGKFVEHKGPRWAMFVATVCFSAGFLISALGLFVGQYWLVVLGYGVVGGIGLGIGYISPVSTLIKWFPDKPGMATGIAIMGFGGGALIASPLSTSLMSAFGKSASGIADTFVVLGVVYAVFMTLGIVLVRVPAPGWKPAGWNPSPEAERKHLVTHANVSASNALKTPQFWLLWVVLCLNVTAGIGIVEKASPMIVDYFKNSSTPVTAAAATGFVALLSVANMAGRFVWSTVSDTVGRKNIYRFYLIVGVLGFAAMKFVGGSSVLIFVAVAMLLLSFYGGGFSAVPAYLKDLFGDFEVGAIHGALLTAWSVAGIAGPYIINAIADAGKAAGKSGPDLYSQAFYIMIVLLVIAVVANELIRPVDPRFHEPEGRAKGAPTGSEAAEVPAAEPAADAAADPEATKVTAPVAADKVETEAQNEATVESGKSDKTDAAKADAKAEQADAEPESEQVAEKAAQKAGTKAESETATETVAAKEDESAKNDLVGADTAKDVK